ncbi:unnamed protein product [Fusarium equiseti]|uniref:Uncharacterized protein n=1 Tax=Fusarium equiseti TaxID=61235 RepID=A0A8J2IMX5_FUSEQ|nr:unnamed protein product [Fusarium equiseti]
MIGDPDPTGVATDENSNGGPAPSHDSTNTSGSPDKTISGPGTEQGQGTAIQTDSAPGTDRAPTGTKTSVPGPDQPATAAPANTILDGQSTLTPSNGDEFTSAASGDVTEDHSGAITTDTNNAPTTLPENQDQTTGSPEESAVVPSDQNSDAQKWTFSSGCDGFNDASVSDCQKAIDSIDTSAENLDPMNAIDTEKVGLWTNTHVFQEFGNCKIGTASQTQPPAPGGSGGAIVGTISYPG